MTLKPKFDRLMSKAPRSYADVVDLAKDPESQDSCSYQSHRRLASHACEIIFMASKPKQELGSLARSPIGEMDSGGLGGILGKIHYREMGLAVDAGTVAVCRSREVGVMHGTCAAERGDGVLLGAGVLRVRCNLGSDRCVCVNRSKDFALESGLRRFDRVDRVACDCHSWANRRHRLAPASSPTVVLSASLSSEQLAST